MPKAKVYNMSGGEVGEMELSDAVFGITPSAASVHAVVRAHLAARRQGTQSALTRAEVSGGGIKPYRQKGTGRARQGSTRAPQWTHGGVAFAPKPREYTLGVNKKTRRLAMRSALSQKAADQKILVIDGLDLPEIKTKAFLAFLNALGVEGKSYVVTDGVRENVVKSARNIQGVRTTVAGVMNVYDIVGAGTLIIDKAAVGSIEEVLAR
ncbi:MAG: 50S ribosomal protein L4 [Oscillospiraceae bacterium]|jgi:large subunit ribosomal protein L4|nr:50S ribosomal protein L4 [Oscillospiraceae bacterium]